MEVAGISVSAISARSSTNQVAQQNAKVDQVQQILERLEARRIVKASIVARESIEDLRTALSSSPFSQTTAAAVAKSSSRFSLDTATTATTLRSTDQINLETSDFGPVNPPWSGSSTADPTVSGVYDGAQNTGDLTFTVTRWGLRGSRNARIQVTGPVGEFITNIRVHRFDPVEQSYDVGNGLSVTFAGNYWELNDTFSVSVEDGPQAPDPDIAFNADPDFEAGVNVVAGSFEINGELIAVAADDTINLILDKINASNAGVSAAYDGVQETIVLTQNEPGSTPTIIVENDTSGFLEATKLASALPVPGEDADLNAPMARVDSLSGVSAGTLLVNGFGIAIDPATDSVSGALLAINQSEAGVVAQLINQSFIVIHSSSGNQLTIDSNGTSFFEALNVASSTYLGQQGNSNSNGNVLNKVFKETLNVTRALNGLFDVPDFAPQSEALSALRNDVAGLLASSLKTFERQGIDLGIRVETALKPFEARLFDQTGQQFRRVLNSNYDTVRAELVGSNQSSKRGLLDELLAKLQDSVFGQYTTGYLIDTLV